MKEYNLDNYGDINKNFALEIARGNVEGFSHASLIGRSSAVGGRFQDIGDVPELSTLDYDAQTGNFTAGLILTGGTSLATAIIVIDDDNGTDGVLTIRNISGTFIDNEIITDSSTGSADSNGVINRILAIDLPTVGQTWEVICESLNDTSAGTGARTIIVSYLDDAYTQQTEIITLNGHTPVTFVATDCFRFISSAVLSWGSSTDEVYGKTNQGSIVIRDSSSKNVMGLITFDNSIEDDEHGFNGTQFGNYTVPAGKTAYITLLVTNTTKNHDVTLRSLIKLFGSDAFITAGEMGNYQNTFTEDLTSAPPPIPEKTDFKIIARSNNTAVSVITQVLITLIDN